MILGFKQKFPWGEPTWFKNRILLCAKKPYEVYIDGVKTTIAPGPLEERGWNVFDGSKLVARLKAKLHTIREDKSARWWAGRSIQMVYRGKHYSIADHFNKDIPELEKCTGTQEFQITFSDYAGGMKFCEVTIGDGWYWAGYVMPNGANLCSLDGDRKMIEQLAHNDGFKDSMEFFRWFNKDFSGKIIHFTNFKYE